MKYSTIKYSTDATTIYSICPMNHIRRPERSIIYGCSSSINGASQNSSTTPRNSIITALPSSSKNGSRYGVTLYPVRTHSSPTGESRECKYKTSINSKMYSRGFYRPFLKLCVQSKSKRKPYPFSSLLLHERVNRTRNTAPNAAKIPHVTSVVIPAPPNTESPLESIPG